MWPRSKPQFFEDKCLTIIISGPNTSDVKLFIGTNLISGIRKFRFYCSITEVIPELEFTCALLAIDGTNKFPFDINDDDIVIYYRDAVDFAVGGLRTIGSAKVYQGHNMLSALNSCELTADATLNNHKLYLEYDTSVITNGVISSKSLLRLNDCPWVVIKAKSGIGAEYDDIDELIKEVKFKEILG